MVLGVGKGTPLCIDAFELVEEIPSRHDPDQTYAYSLWRRRERPPAVPGMARVAARAAVAFMEISKPGTWSACSIPRTTSIALPIRVGHPVHLVAAAEIGGVVPQLAE